MLRDLVIDSRHVLPVAALSARTARASGPGGQHVNRTESKVQLDLDPRLVPWLDAESVRRLHTLAGRNVDSEGVVRITAQSHRDQHRNLEDALERMTELVRQALVRPKRRIATKPTFGSKKRRLSDKKAQAGKKANRARVRDVE